MDILSESPLNREKVKKGGEIFRTIPPKSRKSEIGGTNFE